MKEIQNHIKEKNFKNFYLFTGCEQYLKDYYAKRIVEENIMDINDSFNYLKMLSDIDYKALLNFVTSPPVFSDKKVLVVKNSGIFKSIKEDAKKIWLDVFENVNPDLIIIFSENDIDKRGVLYKKITSLAKCAEFDKQKDTELKKWILKISASYKIKIDDDAIEFLISICSNDMTTILNEFTKLANYKKKEGVITLKDVELNVSKNIENRVFDMIDMLTKGEFKKSYEMFCDLKTLNEPPERILANISAEYLKIRRTKLMYEKEDKNTIAGKIKVPPFFVGKYIEKAKKIKIEKLDEMVFLCQQTDYFIKNGIKEKWDAIENILIQSQI